MPAADDVPEVLSGRYRLDARIGTGGAGSVWRAHDTFLARDVAVKLLHGSLAGGPVARERFRREATAAAAIHHPHAAVVYDIGEDGGRDYLVMELVDGPALVDVAGGGPLHPDVVVAVGHQVADALGAAHARGLAHRDVKPANILLTRDGAAKVVDFGIATALDETTGRLTEVGTVVGTAAYLAPEQLEPDAEVDGRADVYALGLVLHQLLTGRPPFSARTTAEMAAQRLVTDVPPPSRFHPGVPPVIDDLVTKATRRDPGRRFADGSAFAAALAPHLPDRPEQLVAELANRDPSALTRTVELPVPDPAHAATTAVMDSRTRDAAVETTAELAVASGAATTPRSETVQVRPVLEDTVPEPRDPRRRAGWISLAVVALAAVLATTMAGDAPSRRPPEEEPPPAAAGPYPVVAAADFDPFGDDGREHPEDVPSAFDGDPGTAWTTQRYNGADFGGLKPGVGIVFDLGESVPVARLQLLLATAGIDLELHASDQPFEGPPTGTPVATLADAPAEPAMEVGGATGRYWLLWVTAVPGGRAQIAEAAFVRP